MQREKGEAEGDRDIDERQREGRQERQRDGEIYIERQRMCFCRG